MVPESHVTWSTSVPILVFLVVSVLDLGRMYATDRRQASDAHHRLMPPTLEAGHNKPYYTYSVIKVFTKYTLLT